jgi:hypothetical protein
VLEKDTEISWTDRVRNAKVLQRVKKEINILHTIKIRKVELIGYILRRNCLLQQVIEGKIEVMGRRGRSREKLLHVLQKQEDTVH